MLSIPWAVSIHTVTAFLYNGLPGRSFWLTAILAPRFLASAFAAGPALLILLCLVLRRLTRFDAGREPIQKLAVIVTYAMVLNVFFVLLEVFTALLQRDPRAHGPLRIPVRRAAGHAPLAPWMWTSVVLAAVSRRAPARAVATGRRSGPGGDLRAGLRVALDRQGPGADRGRVRAFAARAVTPYVPTVPEVAIVAGIWAVGFLMVTAFYKITLSVREEVAAS